MMRPSTETGMVLYVHGFEVRVFDQMPLGKIASNALTPSSHSTTVDGDTKRIAIFAVLPELRYAMVSSHIFVDTDDPVAMGTIFSVEMYGGAAITRAKAEGVSLLVEG